MNRQALLELCEKLSKGISENESYQSYLSAKNAVEARSDTLALVQRYQLLQLKAQGYLLQGAKLPEELEGELTAMGQLLQFNTAASNFLLAEYSLQKLLSELYEAMQKELRLLQPTGIEAQEDKEDG